jgi:hypothetical protein
MRDIKDSDLVGKTIKSIDTSACNVLKLTFSDNSSLEIWTDTHWVGSGNLPYFYVEDNSSLTNEEFLEIADVAVLESLKGKGVVTHHDKRDATVMYVIHFEFGDRTTFVSIEDGKVTHLYAQG